MYKQVKSPRFVVCARIVELVLLIDGHAQRNMVPSDLDIVSQLISNIQFDHTLLYFDFWSNN